MVISLRASLVALGLLAVPFSVGAQQVVTQQGVMGPTQPPPAIQAENPSPSPGPGHTWIAGYWTWNGTQYSWNAGHWERPPQAGHAWEAPRWERQNGRYQFRAGRWGGQQQQQMGTTQPERPMAMPVMQPQMQPQMQPGVAVPTMQQQMQPQIPGGFMQVPTAMPRPRMERRPRVTPPGQTWVPGFWAWNSGQYTWAPGHFEAPPRPRARWVSPRTERRGRNTVFIPGRWR